jgi:hypothetical protein
MIRKSYNLDKQEIDRFHRMRGFECEASRFWMAVAAERKLDPATIIGDLYRPYVFTALPIGHGKHWCWPAALHCTRRPAA